MNQFVNQEEFEAWLAEQGEARPTRAPVFVAPKLTDKGFYKRRQAQLEFARRQMQVSADMAKVQAQMQDIQRQSEAAEDPARRAELEAQSFALLGKLDGLMEAQARFVDEQVEFLLPFIRAIKDSRPDGTWGYRPRPYGKAEQAVFDAEARELLRDSSQAEFDAMLRAASGQGATPAVPPT